MSQIEDIVRRIVDQMMTRQPKTRIGIVTSYDPNRYAAKVKLQPEGIESGWVPISTLHIGNGYGIAVGLTPGDQVVMGYHEGDPESPFVMGRLHSDQERPPVAQSGEIVIQHKSGAVFKIDTSGNISVSGDGNLTINVTGDIALTSASLTHNTLNVGSTHVHGGVTPGAGDTSTPH